MLPLVSFRTGFTVCKCFFFNDTATTEIYTLSLHDALPILWQLKQRRNLIRPNPGRWPSPKRDTSNRSEEHTSELQSHLNLVCRLLLEKKKTINNLQERCQHDDS